VSQLVFLDSGPLGLITHPQRSAEVLAVTEWLSQWLLNGNRVIVPAIGRLDEFINAISDRYLPLSDEALRLAAELWAKSRRQGQPTADPKALDIDVIIAAQALSFGPVLSDITVATTNPKHLSQFLTAKNWNEIVS